MDFKEFLENYDKNELLEGVDEIWHILSEGVSDKKAQLYSDILSVAKVVIDKNAN